MQRTGPEQQIVLGEELLALEPKLAKWPLGTQREVVKGEIQFGVGSAYVARTRRRRQYREGHLIS